MSGDVHRSLSFRIWKSSNSTACLSVKECATNYSNASACAQRSPNQTWGRIWTESSSGEKQEWEAGERLLSYGRAANNHLSGCHQSRADLSNVVAAVGHWQGRGEATQLHRQWASRSWHHQSRVLRSVLITTAATKWDRKLSSVLTLQLAMAQMCWW